MEEDSKSARSKTWEVFSRVRSDARRWVQLLYMPSAIKARDEARRRRHESAVNDLMSEVGFSGTPQGGANHEAPASGPADGPDQPRETAQRRARGVAERTASRTGSRTALPDSSGNPPHALSEGSGVNRAKHKRPWHDEDKRLGKTSGRRSEITAKIDLTPKASRDSSSVVKGIHKEYFGEQTSEPLTTLSLDSEERWGVDRLDLSVWDALPNEEAHDVDEEDLIKMPGRTEIKNTDTQNVRGLWEECPAADDEVQRATEMPLIYQQIRTIVQHIVTSRPTIKAKGTVSERVRRWFDVEVPIMTGYERTIDTFVQKIALQVLRYGTSFVWRQRTRATGGGDPYEHPVYKAQRLPIVSWAIPDMETVEAFVDRKGRARRFRQKRHMWEKRPRTYQYYDTFVARLPQHNAGKRFWTPPLVWPSLYPAFVLQGLQEDLEAHSQQILPLLAYALVGSDKYQNGRITREDLLETKRTLDRVSQADDTPVLKWYNKLDTIQIESRIDELIDELEYWEQEIRRGVGGSQLQDGIADSGTRNTSEALVGKEMIAAETIVPQIQMAFQSVATDKFFELGGTVDQIGDEEEPPSLYFEEIDKMKQIRREQHFTYVFQNEGLQHGEYREALGRDVDPDRRDDYWSDLREQQDEQTNEGKSRASAKSNGAKSTGNGKS